jgi:2'-5' RNA ligase
MLSKGPTSEASAFGVCGVALKAVLYCPPPEGSPPSRFQIVSDHAMIRAFVAVAIGPEVVRRITEAQSEMKARIGGVRWVAPENFHFTIKFLGPVPEENIDVIASALEEAVSSVPRFVIAARGIGIFPDTRTPRVIWVGLDGKNLEPLVRAVESVLEPLGFAPESRPFQPHLTLGRWSRQETRGKALRKEIERWADTPFGDFSVENMILFRSVLNPRGAVYTALRALPLPALPTET